ncbi:hypothetical protein M9434_006546 [Picochlorum sp. BPE23]|nr:hypothetical protein M9434_006546 [Picochlorum sp. BPE23]
MLLRMYWLQQLLQHVLVVLQQSQGVLRQSMQGNLPLLKGIMRKPPRILYRCPGYTDLYLYKICMRTRFGFVRDCTQQWKEKASSFTGLLCKLLDRGGRTSSTEVRYKFRGKKYRIVLRGDALIEGYRKKSLLSSLDTVFHSTGMAGTVTLQKAVLRRFYGWSMDTEEDVTSRVLKYAGPQGDFYRPYGLSCRICDMFLKHRGTYSVTMTWRHRETGQVYERVHGMSDMPWQPGYLYPRVEQYETPAKMITSHGRVRRAIKRIMRTFKTNHKEYQCQPGRDAIGE